MTTTCCSLAGNSSNCSDSGKGGIEFDSGNFPAKPKDDGLQLANYMFAIYNRVAALGLPNFIGASTPVPSNLKIKAWDQLSVTPQQCQIVEFLTFRFPACFEEPLPTPSTVNHASARAHPQDIAQYIITGMGPCWGPLLTFPSHLGVRLTHS